MSGNRRFYRRKEESGLDHWREKMEEDVSGLGRSVAGFETVIVSLTGSIKTLTQKFDAVQQSQLNNNKTQWPVIFGALAVIGVILGGFMGGYVRDLNRVEADNSSLRTNYVRHITTEERLQREAVVETLSDALESGLSAARRESSLEFKIHQAREVALERRMGHVETAYEELEHILRGLSAEASERFRSLERKVFQSTDHSE